MTEDEEMATFDDLKELINKLIKELEHQGLTDSQIKTVIKNITE